MNNLVPLTIILMTGAITGCATNSEIDEIVASCDAVRESADMASLPDDSLVPTYVPAPKYPRTAEALGREGYAVIKYKILPDGSTKDIELLLERPSGNDFGLSAANAARGIKYKPITLDGKPTEVPCALYQYNFYGRSRS